MIDQNNLGSQNNEQTIAGGNPFDLLDNKNVELAQNNVPTTQQNVSPTPAKKQKGPGRLMKGLIKIVAKVSGQPDPETGKSQVKVNPIDTTKNAIATGQASVNQAMQKSRNAFDNIMGGVTGFLDKVEKKVETVTGFDLDSLGSLPAKTNINPEVAQQTQVAQTTVQPVEQKVEEVLTEEKK